MKTSKDRIKKALEIAISDGMIDGAHHKMWVIDQIIRALTGCPMVPETFKINGETYTYEVQGESIEYKQLIQEACNGEDGPNMYEWDVGIAP